MRKNSIACARCSKGASDPTMTALFNLTAIAETAAVQILDCLVQGTLLAVFAGLLSGAARKQSSGTRFAVWFSALMAIAALPLVGGSWWSHGSSVSTETIGRSAIILPGSWALYALGAWAALAVWFLLGVGRGMWHLHVLRKSCEPVDISALDRRLRETLELQSR